MSDPQPKELLRIFCAVNLSDEARAHAAAHVARLREIVPRARISWVRPENLHLTLKFFGEIDAARLVTITNATARIVDRHEPFVLSLRGAGSFPPRAPTPRVLWLGIEDERGALTRLQERLEVEYERDDWPREPRRFQPHLTIARVRVADEEARRAAEAHLELNFAPVAVHITAVAIMQSELGRGGSRYTICSLHRLRGSSQAPE